MLFCLQFMRPLFYLVAALLRCASAARPEKQITLRGIRLFEKDAIRRTLQAPFI